MEVFTSAKVNLCLDILGRDSNGYHKIQTIYYETKQLQNKLSILGSKENPDTSTLSSPCKSAIQILKSKFKIDKNPEIIIERNIPFSSGLGGESSNAAAILKALNKTVVT